VLENSRVGVLASLFLAPNPLGSKEIPPFVDSARDESAVFSV
jgi:hypothetical protein